MLDNKSQVEVKIIKKEPKQQYTLGVVYEPGVFDSQGDMADAGEIEKACWGYMRKLQGSDNLTKTYSEVLSGIMKALSEGVPVRLDVTDLMDDIEKGNHHINDMHAWDNWGEKPNVVECYIAPCDFSIGLEKIKKGTWLMGVVWPADYFEKIESGKRTGYSMEGKGRRIPIG